MKTATRFLLTLSALGLLAGCDVIDRIPLTPAEAVKAADRFGVTTRQLVEETPEGKVYRLMVQSRHPASWSQADFAMWKELQHSCPDGEPHTTVSTEPQMGESIEERNSQLPAGTHFVRIVRCDPKPHYEFEFETRLPYGDAYGLMMRRLSQATPSTNGQRYVLPIMYSENFPKYEQVRRALGEFLLDQMSKCPAGVVLTHPALGMLPPPDTDQRWVEPAGFIGFVYECAVTPEAVGTAAVDADN